MKLKEGRFIKSLRSMFSLRWDMADPEEIHNTITAGAKLQGTNMCILMLAILIASIGLNMNSTAVIIGAMLISPLMGGITAIGYGIATNDLSLSKSAAIRLGIQVVICLITSTIYFTISPITTASSELLARTTPTAWDVLIALFGGLAGIIGQTRKEKSNVIPGVAIATALMPPLCTAGYGLARHRFDYFSGAMYLFFINSFFICLAAILVLKLLRLPHGNDINPKALKKIHRNIAVIAIVTMLPSIYLAYDIVNTQVDTSSAERFISDAFDFEGTQIVQKTISTDDKLIEVALLGKKISADETKELQNELKDYGLKGYKLVITQTEVEKGVTAEEVERMLEENSDNEETQNKVAQVLAQKENDELKQENEDLKAQLESYQNYNIDVSDVAEELSIVYPQITGAAAGHMNSHSVGSSSSVTGITVVLYENKALSDSQLTTVTEFLKKRLDVTNVTVIQQVEQTTAAKTEKTEKTDKTEKKN
ncbi:DUF389 domain-containing protein [Ruminococcus sp.]|uniref:DUF389 domain-containing protein n=1 Tax=Ruminococcus sp. TaxID=41978 RepID=UPI0025CDFA08|nr:DUF389 domain-containing protein [Ruminococcus sp.]